MADGTGLYRGAIVAVAVIGMAWLAPPASARHNLSMLQLTPALSVAGGEVAVSGFSYTRPVSIHFNSLNGLVLGTFTPDANNDLRGSVTIPADTKPGDYLLLATQDDSGKPTRIPARARLTVAGPGGAAVLSATVAPETRATGILRTDEQPSTASLILVGLSGAGAALFVVGAAIVAASRRRSSKSIAGSGQ